MFIIGDFINQFKGGKMCGYSPADSLGQFLSPAVGVIL